MSFLVFAYRKLSLKRQINEKEFRQLTLSQQKQTMSEKIGVLQQSISAGKNIFSALANSSMYNTQQEINSKYPNGVIPEGERAGIQQQLQNKQYEVAMRTSLSNSIFEAVSNSQMQMLKGTESQMDSEMANLESQLKLIRPELESVEKGETDAAKSEGPKFGLG